jgi:signal transduction histidine kinase
MEQLKEKYDEMIARLQARIAREKASFKDHHNLAAAYYKRGDFPEALKQLEQAIRLQPRSAPSWLLKGIILKESGRFEEAISAFDRFGEIQPFSAKALYHRGTSYFMLGKRHEALQDLKHAVELEPEFLFAHYNLGVAAVEERSWDCAKEAFSACVALDPFNRDGYIELLVEIGKAMALEEIYSQGHRLKNLVGIVGDELRSLAGEIEGNVPKSLGARVELIRNALGYIYADMVQLLKLMDQRPLDIDLVDLNGLLERCLFALSSKLEKLEVKKDLDRDLPEIIGDGKRLEEALLNILLNAIDASADGGEISITTFRPEPGRVAVRISDRGAGIREKDLDKIFRFGYTTKKFGSGIGLSYAEKIVRTHGGRIDVESEQGSGSRFTILLPTSPDIRMKLSTLELRSLLFEDLRELVFLEERGEEEIRIG